ncbi:MAG: hypothetical protein AAFX94_22110 [Myxococcota bacterium]
MPAATHPAAPTRARSEDRYVRPAALKRRDPGPVSVTIDFGVPQRRTGVSLRGKTPAADRDRARAQLKPFARDLFNHALKSLGTHRIEEPVVIDLDAPEVVIGKVRVRER